MGVKDHERCYSWLCVKCGNVIDDIILSNRNSGRDYWRIKTDPEFERMTNKERVLQQYAPEAIFLSF